MAQNSLFRRSGMSEPRAAWAALAACVITIVFAVGTRASFASFIQPIEADLGFDRLTLSIAGSLTALSYGVSLPIVGRLAMRYGARKVMMASVVLMAFGSLSLSRATEAWQLFIFAGVIPGLGYGGASSVPSAVLLAQWFKQRLGLATGIMSSATPAGQSIFIPLAAVVIPLVGWRSTYILFGFLLAAGALPALLLLAKEPPPRVRSAREELPRKRPAAGRDIWLLGAGYFGCGFTDQFVVLHLVAPATEKGLEPVIAASFLSLVLIAGVIGSVISGPLADNRNARSILATNYLARALSLPLLLIPGAGLAALGLFVVTFGLTYIANQAPGARLVRDRYGVAAVGPLMGSVGLAHQVGGAAGIATGGLSVSLTGTYGWSVVVAALVALVAGVLQLLIPPNRERATPSIP